MKRPKTLAPHLEEIWTEIEVEFNSRIGATGLEAVCGQVYQLRKAQAAIAQEGLLVAGQKDGSVIEHPGIKVELSAQAAIRLWREKFGGRFT